MDSPEDSLVSSKTSRSKPVLAVVAVLALAAASWWWMFGRGKGQPENPARVLIVGPSPELAGYLERMGFDADYLSFGEAVGEGRSFDDGLDDLPAIVEYADQHGIGYVALSMAHGEHYDFAAIEYESDEPPPGTTFAVIGIGEFGKRVSYGGVPAQVVHEQPLDEEIGLLLALFGQEELSKARTGQASNDLMIRFGSARTIDALEGFEQAQEKMRRLADDWHALAKKERGTTKPIELAQPFERVVGWPLQNGAILLGSARGAWHSIDGLSTQWDARAAVAELSVVLPTALDQRTACTALPDTLTLDGGFAMSTRGDALLLPSNAYVAELWVLKGEGCGFERRDEIRRLDGGAFGQGHASGRTAESLSGRLNWADAKMRAYRSARLDGVELRPDALRWVSDDIVVIPASLDFALEHEARQLRVAAAAAEAGLPAPEPVAATELPEPTEALVFVRLPPHEEMDSLELAVVPFDTNIRAVFPIAGEAPTVVSYVDSPDGLQLLRTSLAASGPAWQDGLALTYELSAATAAGREAVKTELLAREIPLDAHELVVSPTGSHAAWTAPVDDDFEIFLLALGSPGQTPTRMTDNDRRDFGPTFAGSELLLFYSDYVVDEALPPIESLRALPIP
jgi:hypothetical protein